MKDWTHDELVKHGARWLQAQGCAVVITEMTTGTSETPDAIGWKTRGSILVECKTSRSDFLADKWKPFRREGYRGMGDARYFLTPAGLVKPEELPAGWGLLEMRGEKVKVVKKSTGVPRTGEFSDTPCMNGRVAEITLLVSALRRVGAVAPVGVSVKCYTMDSKGRATLGIEPLKDGKGLEGGAGI